MRMSIVSSAVRLLLTKFLDPDHCRYRILVLAQDLALAICSVPPRVSGVTIWYSLSNSLVQTARKGRLRGRTKARSEDGCRVREANVS